MYEDLAARDGSRFHPGGRTSVMNLATRYLGLQLAHPIVASASPLTATLDGMRRLEDAGAAAVVMASLYEEQIRAEDTAYALYTEHGLGQSARGELAIFPSSPDYDGGVSGHLETLRRASEALDIPVIASLNGTTSEGWIEHARSLEQAGAAAIELNVYSIPVDPAVSGAEVEQRYVDIVREVRASVRIPIAVKLAPYFSLAAAHGGRTGAGRRGRPGAVQPLLRAGHRPPHASRDEIAAACPRPPSCRSRSCGSHSCRAALACSLAASRGVETEVEVVKYLLVGADVVMTASALLRHGPEHLATMREGLERWLGANGFDSVDAIRGLKDASHVENVDALSPRAVRREPHRLRARQARPVDGPPTRVDWLRTLLETSPMTTLFLVIAAGYLVGEINVKGFALGSGAVLFVGLACGAFAPKAAPPGMLGTLGLLLFLYCVGVQYGGEWYRGLTSPSGLKANVAACCGLAASAAVALVIRAHGRRGPAGIARDVRGRHDEYPGAAGRSRRAWQPGRRGRLQPRVPVWRRRTDPLHVRLPRDLQAEDRRCQRTG